jgi:hypothetical protein
MERYSLMPNLAHGVCSFHHTLDSALAILSDLNVPLSRVTVRMSGKGYPTRWVVEQNPAPGEALHPGVRIELSIAGLGYFHALPVGMWDKGDESEPGTRETVELLDDPLQKAGHWVREGARLFDIHPDNPAACARWIALFGVSPDNWPVESWYNLALLLPSLQSLSGTERGVKFALDLMLRLPVKQIQRSPSFRYIREQDLSRLAVHHTCLSLDSIVGDRKEELAKLSMVLGPVSLQTYYEFQKKEKRDLLDSVLGLVTSCYQRHVVSWVVEDVERTPRLGHARRNAVLGINAHLGQARWEEAVEESEMPEGAPPLRVGTR